MANHDFDDEAREGFLAEAEELVDATERSLTRLDALVRGSEPDEREEAELVNEVFRSIHSLKGIASLFGASLMATLSHDLESLLDDVRLGRVAVEPSILDIVFKATGLYPAILAATRNGGPGPEAEVRAWRDALTRREAPSIVETPSAPPSIPPELVNILTEYEAHRLRQNVEAKVPLYWLELSLPLGAMNATLEELKTRMRAAGEVIAYLPSPSAGAASDPDTLALQLLVASRAPLSVLREASSFAAATVEPMGASAFAEAPPRKDVPEETAPKLHSVRVDVRKLDDLLDGVGEIAAVQPALRRLETRVRADPNLRDLRDDVERIRRALERSLTDMRARVLDVRLVPLGQAFDRLARLVRQTASELGKEVSLVVTGADTEIDKLIVEELAGPLMHIVRNAIDHGIEDRDARRRAGKPPVGTIAINAYTKGAHVTIDIEDDGQGIDHAAIAAAAVRQGIMSAAEAQALSAREILALAFRPGFTTKDTATATSGRGVGMDVVKSNIERLGGGVSISSVAGVGATVSLTLPITLAILNVLVGEVRGRAFAVPLTSIESASTLEDAGARTVERDGRFLIVTRRGESLAVARVSALFHLAETEAGDPPDARLVIVRVAERRVGLVFDRLVGREDIVMKSLGRRLAGVRGVSGAGELADGRLGLVLDAASLVDEVLGALR